MSLTRLRTRLKDKNDDITPKNDDITPEKVDTFYFLSYLLTGSVVGSGPLDHPAVRGAHQQIMTTKTLNISQGLFTDTPSKAEWSRKVL